MADGDVVQSARDRHQALAKRLSGHSVLGSASLIFVIDHGDRPLCLSAVSVRELFSAFRFCFLRGIGGFRGLSRRRSHS